MRAFEKTKYNITTDRNGVIYLDYLPVSHSKLPWLFENFGRLDDEILKMDHGFVSYATKIYSLEIDNDHYEMVVRENAFESSCKETLFFRNGSLHNAVGAARIKGDKATYAIRGKLLSYPEFVEEIFKSNRENSIRNDRLISKVFNPLLLQTVVKVNGHTFVIEPSKSQDAKNFLLSALVDDDNYRIIAYDSCSEDCKTLYKILDSLDKYKVVKDQSGIKLYGVHNNHGIAINYTNKSNEIDGKIYSYLDHFGNIKQSSSFNLDLNTSIINPIPGDDLDKNQFTLWKSQLSKNNNVKDFLDEIEKNKRKRREAQAQKELIEKLRASPNHYVGENRNAGSGSDFSKTGKSLGGSLSSAPLLTNTNSGEFSYEDSAAKIRVEPATSAETPYYIAILKDGSLVYDDYIKYGNTLFEIKYNNVEQNKMSGKAYPVTKRKPKVVKVTKTKTAPSVVYEELTSEEVEALTKIFIEHLPELREFEDEIHEAARQALISKGIDPDEFYREAEPDPEQEAVKDVEVNTANDSGTTKRIRSAPDLNGTRTEQVVNGFKFGFKKGVVNNSSRMLADKITSMTPFEDNELMERLVQTILLFGTAETLDRIPEGMADKLRLSEDTRLNAASLCRYLSGENIGRDFVDWAEMMLPLFAQVLQDFTAEELSDLANDIEAQAQEEEEEGEERIYADEVFSKVEQVEEAVAK